MKKYFSFILLSFLSLNHIIGQNKEDFYFQAIDSNLTWIISEISNAPCSKPYRCNELKIVRIEGDSVINTTIFNRIIIRPEFSKNTRILNGLIRQELDNKIYLIPKNGKISDEILLIDNTQRFHVFDYSKINFDTLTIDKLNHDIENSNDYIKSNSYALINLLDFINRTFTYRFEPKSSIVSNGRNITSFTTGAPRYKIIGIKYRNDYLYQSDNFKNYKKRIKKQL